MLSLCGLRLCGVEFVWSEVVCVVWSEVVWC